MHDEVEVIESFKEAIENSKQYQREFSKQIDKLNEIRETSLTISRAIVRDCSKSIRFIHRNDIKGAEEFIDNAKKKITEVLIK